MPKVNTFKIGDGVRNIQDGGIGRVVALACYEVGDPSCLVQVGRITPEGLLSWQDTTGRTFARVWIEECALAPFDLPNVAK